MNSVIKKVTNQDSDIKKLEKRIKDLENLTTNLSILLEEEKTKRQGFEENALTKQTGNYQQIENLKNAIDELSNLLNQSIEDIKLKTNNILDDRSNKLQNMIDKKIKIFDIYDKKTAENEFNHKNFEDNINLKFFNLKNEVESTFKNFREELNTNATRLDFFEKKLFDNFNTIKEEINNLNKDVLEIKNELNSLKLFKENSNNNFRIIKSDMLNQEEIITNFTNKVSLMINEFDNKLNQFDIYFTKQNECLNSMKEDLINHITSSDNKLANKLNDLNDIIENYNNKQINEINNFEKHILDEEEKFNLFIQDKLSQETENCKKMLYFSGEEINNLKNKSEQLEKNQDFIKNQFFNNLNEAEEFLTKKYEGLFRMLSSKNLIPNKNDNSFNLNSDSESNFIYNCNNC